MRYCKIVDVFKHKGRTIVIVKSMFSSAFIGIYHNGYVSTRKSNEGRGYDEFVSKIDTDELTFSGTLKHLKDKKIPNLWFMGFDSAHYWNTENRESQTFESVRKRAIKLAEEMIRKGV